MADPTDDELNGSPSERAEEGESGEGKKGKSGGAAFLSTQNPDEEDQRSKKTDSGEGDADSFGRGKAGAGSGVARLAPQKLKEVMANWRELTAQDLVDAVTEFFSEGPMRASANAVVSWVKNANAKSFAIVNWAIEAGDTAVRMLARERERIAGKDSRGLQQKRPVKSPANKFGLDLGMNGPVPGGSGG